MSLGGWLRCHSFVGAPICLIFHLYSGKHRQAAAVPLLLFLRVHLRHSAQPLTTSLGFGEIWPRWKFLLVAPMSRQHMDTCLLSTSPIIPHSIVFPIKSQNTPQPHHPPTLEEASRHGCNYNQTRTLCSATCCASHSANPHSSIHFLVVLGWSPPPRNSSSQLILPL